jgi:hypothetical protein
MYVCFSGGTRFALTSVLGSTDRKLTAMNTPRVTQLKLSDSLNTNRYHRTLLVKGSVHRHRILDRLRSGAIHIAFTLLCIALLYSAINVARADSVDVYGRALQSRESIRTAAENHVRSSGVSIPSGGVLHATATDLDSRLQLALCNAPLTTFTLNSAPVSTRTTIGVRCTEPEWTVYVPVAVESEITRSAYRQ